ncbi:MAG: hypothetical protein ICV53_21685 [Flavisolibacter sp.]|nr:hypothetical protein [Flavisolibacter sp.]
MSGLKDELVHINGLQAVTINPVTYTVNESLFSIGFHRITNVHVDARIPSRAKFQRQIHHQLESNGIRNVSVYYIKDGEVILKNTALPLAPKDVPVNSTDRTNILPKERLTSSSAGKPLAHSPSADTVTDIKHEYEIIKVFHQSQVLTKEEIKALDYLRIKLGKRANVVKLAWETQQDLLKFFSSHDLEVTVERADDLLNISGGKNMRISTSGRNALLIFRYGKLVYICPDKMCADDAAIHFFQLKSES